MSEARMRVSRPLTGSAVRAPITDAEVRELVTLTFGREAGATLAYRPGAAVDAARATDYEQNTYERTLTKIIRDNLGNRAAAVHTVAEILIKSLPENEWPTDDGLFTHAPRWRRWTKADLAVIKKPLPMGRVTP